MAKQKSLTTSSKVLVVSRKDVKAAGKKVQDETTVVDDLTHVLEELDSYGGRTKQIGSNVHVICPFHDERTPSCSVNLSREADVPIGAFYCFGCGTYGGWNKFAEKTGLKQVKKWQCFESDASGGAIRFSKKAIDLMGANNMSIQRLFDEIGNAVIPWPKDRKWRSYSGKLISRIGGYCFNDNQRDELMLVLPVYTNGRYRGGVRAFFEKQDNGLSYLTTKGDWVKSYGLLGYDYMLKKNLWGCKAIVLVEGPRDWLRLVKNKIPACGILGANMFDAKKLQLLIAFGIRKLFVLPDNDTAGKKMATTVEAFAKEAGIPCEYLKLPRKKGADGKVIKMDPDNAPDSIINEVKKLVYSV